MAESPQERRDRLLGEALRAEQKRREEMRAIQESYRASATGGGAGGGCLLSLLMLPFTLLRRR